MRSAPAACPFCNAELPPLSASPLAPRTPCPRCGEPVPSDRFPVDATAIAAGPPPVKPSLPDRKRFTLRVLLSIMAGMAALALVFALLTQKTRRDRDPQPRPEPPEQLAQAPAQLLGLRYLPRGSNLVAAVQVAALRENAAGQALLREPR